MLDVTAEQLVFLDESIFKIQSGWRGIAYGPIGEHIRYRTDMRRGATLIILPAYTTKGYLPCTSVKEGYFTTEQFLSWLKNELLPHCNPFLGPRSVIILNNLNVHLDARIRQAIEEARLLLEFLPPYSPDFNPIELTFGLLKAWMKRYFESLYTRFEGNFGGILRFAIQESEYDRFAVEYFRYYAGGYIFEGDCEAL